MLKCSRLLLGAVYTVALAFAQDARAAGGTTIVASKEQPAHVSAAWPSGVDDLVNDASRTTGWNSWFSEWPNDVNQYAFEIKSAEDVNRLMTKLVAIKTDLKQVRLSYLKEPKGLGWVTSVPEGNAIAVIFSIGDQSRIDQWYERVRKPFGKMVFTATPVAVPPTLTIFVQNEAIDLDKLKVPEGVELSAGYLPAVFHKFNTADEEQREQEAAKNKSKANNQNLDEASQAAIKKIDAFVQSRNRR